VPVLNLEEDEVFYFFLFLGYKRVDLALLHKSAVPELLSTIRKLARYPIPQCVYKVRVGFSRQKG